MTIPHYHCSVCIGSLGGDLKENLVQPPNPLIHKVESLVVLVSKLIPKCT